MNYPFKKKQGKPIKANFAKKLMQKFGLICYDSYTNEYCRIITNSVILFGEKVNMYSFQKYNLKEDRWKTFFRAKDPIIEGNLWFEAIPKKEKKRLSFSDKINVELSEARKKEKQTKYESLQDSIKEHLEKQDELKKQALLHVEYGDSLEAVNSNVLGNGTMYTEIKFKCGTTIQIINPRNTVQFIKRNNNYAKG